jgi:hypothetical protein
MKKFFVIFGILIIGWYGNSLYKQNDLPFLRNGAFSFESDEQVKCITKDGKVLYGSVPKGIKCERLERVNGSLTIVPSETLDQYIGDNDKNRRTSSYQCDGRTYCSQMNSCEEATFFLRNCPETKMDGNNDGIPCEKQWCNK